MDNSKDLVKKAGKKAEKKSSPPKKRGPRKSRAKELVIAGPEIKVNGKSVAGGIQTTMQVSQLPDMSALIDFCRESHSEVLTRVLSPIGTFSLLAEEEEESLSPSVKETVG